MKLTKNKKINLNEPNSIDHQNRPRINGAVVVPYVSSKHVLLNEFRYLISRIESAMKLKDGELKYDLRLEKKKDEPASESKIGSEKVVGYFEISLSINDLSKAAEICLIENIYFSMFALWEHRLKNVKIQTAGPIEGYDSQLLGIIEDEDDKNDLEESFCENGVKNSLNEVNWSYHGVAVLSECHSREEFESAFRRSMALLPMHICVGCGEVHWLLRYLPPSQVGSVSAYFALSDVEKYGGGWQKVVFDELRSALSDGWAGSFKDLAPLGNANEGLEGVLLGIHRDNESSDELVVSDNLLNRR